MLLFFFLNLQIDPKLYINSLNQILNLSKGIEPAFVTFIDYVISSRGGFPWETMPPLVIGRRAYDNYIVSGICINYGNDM